MKHILAIVGSNSQSSINRQLADWLALQQPGIDVVQVSDYPAALLGVDLERESGVPAPMVQLREEIGAADAIVLVSPEHNGSMPAVLKNAIDWMSRIDGQKLFQHKPLLLLSTSPGKRGGATNLDHIATLAPHWGAVVSGKHSIGSWYSAFDAETGELTDPGHREAVLELLQSLGRAAAA